MTPSKRTQLFISLVLALFIYMDAGAANIVRPWRSTTAIVLAGETFEVWVNADEGQNVESIELNGPFHSVGCSHVLTTGDWVYDPLSGNSFNRRVLVTVPADAPEDRYDLVVKTNTGELTSYGGVKVLKTFKEDYYIMHMSDGHIYQAGYDTRTLLARKILCWSEVISGSSGRGSLIRRASKKSLILG